MIGLGSNRLTVCRRGGMSVTQAGRGGMEWLAGGRVPDWVTPYSAQATAALKAAFTAAQWPTIRDYGFAHPEIVPFVNAYCPTYPDLACEFCKIGYCSINGDNACYFNTGIKTTEAKRIEVDAYFNQQNRAFIGARNGSLSTGSTYCIGWDPSIYLMYDLTSTRVSVNVEPFKWHNLVLDREEKKGYLDGVQVATFTANSISVANDLFLLALNNGGGTVTYWGGTSCKIAAAKVKVGDTLHWFIPIENNKIIDVATGTIITKSGSGTATYARVIS